MICRYQLNAYAERCKTVRYQLRSLGAHGIFGSTADEYSQADLFAEISDVPVLINGIALLRQKRERKLPVIAVNDLRAVIQP